MSQSGQIRHGDTSIIYFLRYLSVMGFIINIDTLLLMIPELLQHQEYICTVFQRNNRTMGLSNL